MEEMELMQRVIW